jgi:hypothetical protein
MCLTLVVALNAQATVSSAINITFTSQVTASSAQVIARSAINIAFTAQVVARSAQVIAWRAINIAFTSQATVRRPYPFIVHPQQLAFNFYNKAKQYTLAQWHIF